MSEPRYESTLQTENGGSNVSNLRPRTRAAAHPPRGSLTLWRIWERLRRSKASNRSHVGDSVELLNSPAHTNSGSRSPTSKHQAAVSESEETDTDRNTSARSWRPVMLRRRSLFALAGVCLILIALLQVVDSLVRRNQGIGTHHPTKVNALRYMPTVVMVILGFVWRSLVSDLKLITPWAAMTERSVRAADSLTPNYINAIEIFSVWTAARRKHWPLCVGIVGALLTAALVSFTNALTYVNVAHITVEHGVKLRQTTEFDFTDRFVYPNGSLAIAWSYTGNRPYAAIISAQQQNGRAPSWTDDRAAYTSLALVNSPVGGFNGTIEAEATQFWAYLDCTSVKTFVVKSQPCTEQDKLTGRVSAWRSLRPDPDDLKAAGCEDLPPIDLATPPGSPTYNASCSAYDGDPPELKSWPLLSASSQVAPAAWLNLTQCGSGQDRKLKMWAHLLRPSHGDPNATSYDTRSLLCEPLFETQQVMLTVNVSNGYVIAQSTLPGVDPIPLDNGLTLDTLVTYLNNPLDSSSLDAYEATSLRRGNAVNTQLVTPQVTIQNVTDWAEYYFRVNGQDPFFSQALNSDGSLLSEAFFNSPLEGAFAMSDLFGSYMAQLTNSMARKDVSNNMTGTTRTEQPRVLVRQWALRAGQGTLLLLAIICVLLATSLYVPSCLAEDCGTLAAVAVVLANSPSLENMLRRTKSISDDSTLHMSRRPDGAICVEPVDLGDEIRGPDHGHTRDRFRPTALHWLYILGILMAGLASLAAIAATLQEAKGALRVSTNGNAWLAQDAWAYLPTIILLLFGYTLAGLSDSIHLLEPYRNLQRSDAGEYGRLTLLFNPINHSVFSLPYRAVAGVGSLVVLWTSVTILTYPGVKIAAAGLYTATTTDLWFTIPPVTVNSSLVDNLERTYTLSNAATAGITNRASQWSEWSRIKDFQLPPRIDTLNNLVFSTIDADISNVDSIRARIPAVEVDVRCTRHDPGDFTLWVTAEDNGLQGSTMNWSFQPRTKDVNSTGVSMVNYHQRRMLENGFSLPKYIGAAFLPTTSDGVVIPGTPYTLLLAEYTSLQTGVKNLTYVPEMSGNQTFQNLSRPAYSAMFNATLPTVRAVVCTRDLNRVLVDVTLTKDNGDKGYAEALPWSVSGYDPASISNRTAYSRDTPGWMYPYYPTDDGAMSGLTNASVAGNAVEVVGDTIWPAKAASRNPWQQLAVYQQSRFRDSLLSESLLDVDNLANAAEAMLTTYSVQMLSELRAYTSQLSSTRSKRAEGITTTAQAYRRVPAVTQSAKVTYVIAAMLATVVSCSVMAASVYLPLPGRRDRTLHLKAPPGSIAAAMVLLAGSNLVRQLRDQGVTVTAQTQIWSTRFRLGCWIDGIPQKAVAAHSIHSPVAQNRRWGIDIVE